MKIIAPLAVIFVCLGFVENFQKISDLPPLTEQSLYCDAPLSANQDVFDVYMTEATLAVQTLSLLCEDPVIQRQYGNVKVVIGHSDYDTFRYVNHGLPELALVKSNVVSAFSADSIYSYEAIAAHRDYQAYFIATREKPELSKEYLLGKRIGILDYPSSRSGHIVPKTVLQKLRLDDNTVDLRYYNSHQELRAALLAGEVDMISSYWANSDESSLSKNYITALEDSVSGMRWYLKMNNRNTDLHCAVQQVISKVAEMASRSYYQEINLIGDCDDAV